MAISKTLERFLRQRGVDFIAVPHAHTVSSNDTAAALQVPSERVAKAVVLKDDEGYLMAVIPAACHINLGRLHQQLERPLEPAQEPELDRLFPDCAVGAVPAAGAAFGVKTVCDISLSEQWEVYLEAGDHETALRLSNEQFQTLMADVPKGIFGTTL